MSHHRTPTRGESSAFCSRNEQRRIRVQQILLRQVARISPDEEVRRDPR
jgi:hypothetical protein